MSESHALMREQTLDQPTHPAYVPYTPHPPPVGGEVSSA
jgi:hypothetical protein